MRKIVSILLVSIFVLSNISIIPVHAAYTTTNDGYTVVNYAKAAVGTHAMSKKGLCQTFAWECLYDTLGVSNKAGCGCCATKAWQSYGVSSSRDDIPLGAAVYFGGSSTIDSVCNQEAGHVGIYIGNNEIAHAWSSTIICKTTIDYVINCGYYYRGWGWQGGYALATGSFDTETSNVVNLGENFYAYIGHQSTGKWLSNVNNNIEGANPTGNPNQIWNFIRQSDGSYVIKNMSNNSYMDVWGTSTDTGTNVYCCNTYTGDVNQRFFIYYMYDAYYFRPVYTNMNLDMNSTTYNLELWGHGEDWAPQEFNIQIIDENGNLPLNLGENFYAYIGHQSTGKYLSNASGNIRGDVQSGNSEQIWNFIRQFDGSYVIKNMLNGSYMDVWGTSTDTGTNVYCCNTYTGDVNQRFFIYHMYDAYYIRPTYTRMRLDMNTTTYNLELWGIGENWAPQEFDIKIIDENGNLPLNLGMDFYATIQNISFNKYLTNNANNIEGQDFNNDKSQLWHFVRCPDGSYTIKNILNNSYMDVWGTSTDTGTNVYCCNTYTGDVNQRFFVYYMYDAYYIRPTYTRMRLDMSSTTYNLELWGIGENWAPQEFDIKKQELYSLIEFKSVDSKNMPMPITKCYGENVTISEIIPIRNGYRFTNWNTEHDGTGVTYNPGDSYASNKSIVLYAQWKKLIPKTESVVIKRGSNYIINILPVDIDDSCEIIIAGYKSGKFVTLTSSSYNLEEINTILYGDIDEIKVMLWDSLSGLKPLCEAEVIPSSEFIVE